MGTASFSFRRRLDRSKRGMLFIGAGVIMVLVGLFAGSTFGEDMTPIFIIIGVGAGVAITGVALRASSGGRITCTDHGLCIDQREIKREEIASIRTHKHTGGGVYSRGHKQTTTTWTVLIALAQQDGNEIELFETYSAKQATNMANKISAVLKLGNPQA